ncbi:hypothetical protein SNOG_02990 [Parastagonospora nodorum SN15]|uniref:Uncharacterized protein n=1 Tax=Phaeosphaeria nodorum (strain SN15 / ATCC MYA-4574 / FGSC 10173) TaxID=321614 RepID=Q0UZ24_PHANO|nr:hypothetical protein SNOG_02990 [Parastagonospora nodorum SN15]EAT89721.1 hypothetical protein SNOG_02990 [Parastagonospora nodorum SN15]
MTVHLCTCDAEPGIGALRMALDSTRIYHPSGLRSNPPYTFKTTWLQELEPVFKM